jgi:Uma2 family endonuclease
MGDVIPYGSMGTWSPALMPRAKTPGRTMTLEEWWALPEEEDSGELVEGRLIEEEVPSWVHELAVTWLIATVRSWLVGRGGFVAGSDLKLRISARTGRKPDMIVVLPGSPPPQRTGAMRAPPDVVVEVVSPSPRDERRDRVEKMSDYAAAGVRFYWLVDPGLGSFEVFELGSDRRYTRALAATEGKIEDVPGCEGLVIDLDALWSELERLAPEEGEQAP